MPLKILIVDDDADNREMLTTLLRGAGYTVVAAEDGRAGLDLARSQRPHLILTDLSMPNLNGVEMIRSLRAQPGMSNVPIIACTAHSSGVAASDALKVGANHATYKPVQFSSLLPLIAELLAMASAVGLLVGIAAGECGD